MKQTSKSLKKCLLGLSVGLILLNACNDQVKTGLSRAPGAPTDLVAGDTKFSDDFKRGTVTLSWKAPKDAGAKDDGTLATITGYQVEYTSAADFSDASKVKKLEVSEAKAALNDLEALGTTWRVRVFAKNASKKPISVASQILEVKVGEVSVAEPALKPATPTVSSTSDNSVVLVVTVDTDAENLFGKNAVGTAYKGIYRLEQTGTDPAGGTVTYSNTGKTISLDQKTQTITINSGLDADTDYWFRVVAIPIDKNQDELTALSVYGNPVKAETTTATPPAPATQVTFSAPSDTSVVASFTPSTEGGLKRDGATKANIIGYKLIVSDQEDFGNVVAENTVENPAASLVSVAGLTASTTYYAQLITLSDNDDPDKREAVSQVANSQVTTATPHPETAAATPPTPTVVKSYKSISVTVPAYEGADAQFGYVDGGFTGLPGEYKLELYDPDTDSWSDTGKDIAADRETTVTIDQLTVSTAYKVRVRAYPKKEGEDVKESLRTTSVEVDAVTKDISVPGSPQNALATTVSESVIALSWSVPTDDGGQEITGYEVYWNYVSGVTDGTGIAVTVNGTNTSVRVEGLLKRGTTYYFAIYALNASGKGEKVEVSGHTTTTAPKPPRQLRVDATQSTETSLTLSWELPLDDGGSAITSYKLYYATDPNTVTTSKTFITVDGEEHSVTVSNLSDGETYTFTIYAENAVGRSIASLYTTGITGPAPREKETAATSPPTPTVVVSYDSISVTVPAYSRSSIPQFGYSYDGTTERTGEYKLELYDPDTGEWSDTGEDIATDQETTVTIGSLTAGTDYKVRVKAYPKEGGEYVAANLRRESSPVSATTRVFGTPSAPQTPQATAFASDSSNVAKIEVSWSVPTDDGGKEITGYELSWSDVSGVTYHSAVSRMVVSGATTTSATIKDLPKKSTTYYFVIYAINDAGRGEQSSEVSAIYDE